MKNEFVIANKMPVAGLALILGVDRFMSEARALTNIIGNGVATIVIARWEGVLDRPRLAAELAAGGRAANSAPIDLRRGDHEQLHQQPYSPADSA